MVLREVAVGFVFSSLLALGCVKKRPIVAPTVVVVDAVVGGAVIASSEVPDDGGTWKAKDEVEVEWQGSWWPAVVVEKRGNRWLVHYEGYTNEWDEVVAGDRIRERHIELKVDDRSQVDDIPDP